MKIMKYSIFSEDTANRVCVEAIFEQMLEIFELENQFEYDTQYLKLSKNITNEYVKTEFVNEVKKGVALDLNLIIVALDLDFNNVHQKITIDLDFLNNEQRKQFEAMSNQLLENNLDDYTLISISVRAIEHWLYLIQIDKNNLTPIQEPIELIETKYLKSIVYGRKKMNTRKQRPFIRDLTQQINFEYLKQNSKSFEHFYNQVSKYLAEQTASKF